MKAQRSVTEKREQPKPLPVPFNEKNWERLLPYQQHPYFLAEARLKMEGVEGAAHIDAINWLLYRSAALCDIVAEAGGSESESSFPRESLVTVMGIIREDIETAKVLAGKMHEGNQDAAPGGAA
jgi:hypothetical protein